MASDIYSRVVFRSLHLLPACLAALAALAALAPAPLPAAEIDGDAKRLARLLKPPPLNPKGTAKDLPAARAHLIRIITELEKTKRTNGPTPESILPKAYSFREDVGRYQAMTATANLIAAWEDARAMGLFTGEGKFQDRIGRGRDRGKQAVFEFIVPPAHAPEFSRHFANVRIVSPSQKRTEGAPLTSRESAYLAQYQKIVSETSTRREVRDIEKPEPLNEIGQTKKEAEEIWRAEVRKAGDAAKSLPNIRIQAKTGATPSHMSKDRWRIDVEVVNTSPYPTEIELEYYLFGITWKKRDHYVMVKQSRKMKLRKGQVADFSVYTGAKNSYKKKADDHDGLSKKERARSRVYFRGYVLLARHAKGIAGATASDQRVASYFNSDTDLDIARVLKF